METEREMSRYEVTPIGIFLETWDGRGGISRECLMPRDCFVEAYEKWIKNTPTEKNEAIETLEQEPRKGHGHWTTKRYQAPIENKQAPTVSGTIFSTEPTACKLVYTYIHSDCKSEEYLKPYNYCPNCGAKMDEYDNKESEEG